MAISSDRLSQSTSPSMFRPITIALEHFIMRWMSISLKNSGRGQNWEHWQNAQVNEWTNALQSPGLIKELCSHTWLDRYCTTQSWYFSVSSRSRVSYGFLILQILTLLLFTLCQHERRTHRKIYCDSERNNLIPQFSMDQSKKLQRST